MDNSDKEAQTFVEMATISDHATTLAGGACRIDTILDDADPRSRFRQTDRLDTRGMSSHRPGVVAHLDGSALS